MTTAAPARSAGGRRRWVVPPMPRGGGEPLEGAGILAEVPGSAGLALWQAQRDAGLWSAAPPERRADLWKGGRPCTPPAGTPAPEAERALAALAEALSPAGRAGAVGEACLALARWAAADGKPRTALAFAGAAARAEPTAAAAALEAGHAWRLAGDPVRAEAWFRRAVALARRARDWNSYGLAHCGWAGALRGRDDAGATAHLHAALRMARRHGLWRVKPVALAELCSMACEAGALAEGARHGRRALRAFGRRDTRLGLLAHDLGRAWMAAGYRTAALRVLRPAAERLRGLPARADVLATLATAAVPGAQAEAPPEVDSLSFDLAETLSLRVDAW